MELLAFVIGLMIMGPIVFLYFLLQDLKKRIVKIEKNNYSVVKIHILLA